MRHLGTWQCCFWVGTFCPRDISNLVFFGSQCKKVKALGLIHVFLRNLWGFLLRWFVQKKFLIPFHYVGSFLKVWGYVYKWRDDIVVDTSTCKRNRSYCERIWNEFDHLQTREKSKKYWITASFLVLVDWPLRFLPPFCNK